MSAEHPSIAHPIGTWRETTYGAWGSETITVRFCLRRDCDWREATSTVPRPAGWSLHRAGAMNEGRRG